MPITRYEIRDEYSLADPELYRAADKDDPEALLEGVAMAGLVGVLRQLGDLAEFAAEIFHELHEEVMVTAARGHTLMIRVQQLEADIPSVEKAFLSRTDHSSFFYNSGVDWHGNRRVDQNLVTQGDLPRFVMDCYEECRGPPRLFLLDKFDVAGAGACLKRYTDPSFFKVETSSTANADFLKEKKMRKAKKKGPYGRHGERPESLQASSHAKLHQLLLEEPVENGGNKPAYRAKLKRRPNGFPFDTNSGKSYMEGLFPEHKMTHENISSSPSQMSIDGHNESVLELRSVSPVRDNEGRKGSPPYRDGEETMLNPSMDQTNYASSDIKTYGAPSYLNALTDGVLSTSDEETGGKDIAIDGESKMEDSLISYQSDEIASEIDNYVDAPSTMESEMDTDSELRVKKDSSFCTENQPLASVKDQEHCHSLSFDSHSTGDFSISDEGNNSYKKEMSSFLSSDSPRTSGENHQSEKLSADGSSCTDIPEYVIVDASSFKRIPEHFPVDKVSKPVLSDHTYPGKDSVPDTRPNFEQSAISLRCTNSIPTFPRYDSSAVARGGGLGGAESDETLSNPDDEEKKRNLILHSPCSPSVSHSKSLGDDSKRSSSAEHLVDGEILFASICADNIYHTSDHVDPVSAYALHEEDYDQTIINQFENSPSIKMDNVISWDRINIEEIGSKEKPTPSLSGNQVAELTDNFVTDYTDIACNGDNAVSRVSEGENQSNNLYTEYPKVVSENVDSEDHYTNTSNVNQISTETLISSGTENSTILFKAGLDTHYTDFTPEELTTINELGNPKSSEVVGLQVTGIADDATLNNPVYLESSFYVQENLEDSSGKSHTSEKDAINPDSDIAGLQLTEISSSSSLKLLGQAPVPLDEFDSVTYQSESVMMASSLPAVSDDTIMANVSSPAVLGKLVEEQGPCFQDLGLGILENDTVSLAGVIRAPEVVEEEKSDHVEYHKESGLVEEGAESEATVIDFDRVCTTEHDDHPKPEVSHTDFILYLDSEVKHKVGTVNAAQIQPPLEQSRVDTKVESGQQRLVVNQVSDIDPLHIRCFAEEAILPETIALPPNAIDNKSPDSCAIISSESSSTFSPSQLQTWDCDNDKTVGNLVSSFPLENCPSSDSTLLGGTDASANPKDPLGFIFSSGNLFSETNQTNLDESHPLPPLPPLQWRIGKLQHASSVTEADKMETMKVLPQEIFPPVASIGNIKSVPEQEIQSPLQSLHTTFKEKNLENGYPNLDITSLHSTIDFPQKVENNQLQLFTLTKDIEVPLPAEEVGAAEDSQTVKYPIQRAPQSILPEENVGPCSPTLKAESVNQADGPPPKVEIEQQCLLALNQESEVPSPAAEDGAAEESQTVKYPVQRVPQSVLQEENIGLCPPTLKADSVNQANGPSSNVEKEQQQLLVLTQESEVPSPAVEDGAVEESQTVKYPVQRVPQSILQEENIGPCSPAVKADSVNQADGPPPKVEKEQQHLLVLTQESEVPSLAVEDGVANSSRTMKLPRTCNPIIGSVAALDKSRLRKVTGQVKPPMGKQDERNAMLDQIRAKSFNLKPATISRPSVPVPVPSTNLKVAAILEKANAIRQAFAGSDEDDEDSWSDS